MLNKFLRNYENKNTTLYNKFKHIYYTFIVKHCNA